MGASVPIRMHRAMAEEMQRNKRSLGAMSCTGPDFTSVVSRKIAKRGGGGISRRARRHGDAEEGSGVGAGCAEGQKNGV